MHFQYLQKVFKQVLMLARIDSFVLVGEKRQSLINQLYVYKKKNKNPRLLSGRLLAQPENKLGEVHLSPVDCILLSCR